MSPLHLYTREFRVRFFSLVCSFVLTFCTLYRYADTYFYFVAKPLQMTRFIFTDISEAFQTYLEVSFALTFVFLFPCVVYQIFSFCVPGFFCHEKKQFLTYMQSLCLLSCVSLFFTWAFLLPLLWSFFTDFEVHTGMLHIELEPRILPNLRFIVKVFVFSQLFFQVPYVGFLYLRAYGKTQHMSFSQNRTLVYIGILLVCSSVCPPDVFLQVSSSLMCIFLFEVFLFLLFLCRSYESVGFGQENPILKKDHTKLQGAKQL